MVRIFGTRTLHPKTGAIVVRSEIAYFEGGRVSPRLKRAAAALRHRRATLYTELAK